MSRDLGIDLGTTNLLVYARGKGIVLREPSVIAVHRENRGKIQAVGDQAHAMIGRSPESLEAIRPLSDGVIADYVYACKLLQYIIDRVCGSRRLFRPRVLISVPPGATNVELRAILQAAREAGAGEAILIEEPKAAALGAKLPIETPTGTMVVDIGGGTTDIAVISLQGSVVSDSLRLGGRRMDEMIVRHVKRAHILAIGEQTGEEIKIAIGSAYRSSREPTMKVKGRNLQTGLPATVTVTGAEIRECLAEAVAAIVQRVRWLLEQTPPELAADIVDRGIVLTGGGALLKGMDHAISEETRLTVVVAEDPLTCVARGTGQALEFLGTRREINLFYREGGRT